MGFHGPTLHAFSEDIPSKAAPVPLSFMYTTVYFVTSE